MYRMSQQKQAANLRAALVQVFAGHQQFVKDYVRFIHVLSADILTWPSTWNIDLVASDLKVKDTIEKGWEGKQTYGGRESPPEYEEGYTEVATSVSLRLQADLNVRTFPRQFTAAYRAHVKDLKGFFTATQKMFEDSGLVGLFGKLLRTVLPVYIKSNTYDSVAYAYDDIVAEAETASNPWQVTYNISKVVPGRAMSKPTSTGLKVWVDGEALMGSGNITPPPDDDYGDDYGSRWAKSITRVAHRYIQATQKSAVDRVQKKRVSRLAERRQRLAAYNDWSRFYDFSKDYSKDEWHLSFTSNYRQVPVTDEAHAQREGARIGQVETRLHKQVLAAFIRVLPKGFSVDTTPKTYYFKASHGNPAEASTSINTRLTVPDNPDPKDPNSRVQVEAAEKALKRAGFKDNVRAYD